jgi:hypothetical protein
MSVLDENFSCIMNEIPVPTDASEEFVRMVGLEPAPFLRWLEASEIPSWSIAAEAYFCRFSGDVTLGDDAFSDFLYMGFTREVANRASARIGEYYGHYAPWEWAAIELHGEIENLLWKGGPKRTAEKGWFRES